MVVGNHHVDRGQGVVRQPSAIIVTAIDSALTTGEDNTRIERSLSGSGQTGEKHAQHVVHVYMCMCMYMLYICGQARAWRRTGAWARTLRRSWPCPSPHTSTSEAVGSVEAAWEPAEAVAEVGAAEVLGLAAQAASAVARAARVAVGDRRSVEPQSGKPTGRWSQGHDCGRELARARACARLYGVVEVD